MKYPKIACPLLPEKPPMTVYDLYMMTGNELYTATFDLDVIVNELEIITVYDQIIAYELGIMVFELC